MESTIANLTHAAQRKAAEKIIDIVLNKVRNDRENGLQKVVDFAKPFIGDGISDEQFEKVQAMIRDPENRWIKVANRILDETDPHVAKMAALNLGYEAFLRGTKTIRKNREKYHCNIPWLILFDPTSACNMHCAGRWSGTYGHKHKLSFEDMDNIHPQGKELGLTLYLLTGD